MSNRRARRSGIWLPVAWPPGWGLTAVVAIAVALAIAAAASVLAPARDGEEATVLDASSPGPFEVVAEPDEPAPAEPPTAEDGGPSEDEPAAAEPSAAAEESSAAEEPLAAADGRSRRLWPGDGFRLARVRSGARIELFKRPGEEPVERVGPRTEFGSRTVLSVVSRRGRWLRIASPLPEDNRRLWVRVDRRRLRFENTDVAIHVSLSERSVEVRRGGQLVRRFRVTIGAAGSSTPIGRFGVTDLIVGGLNPVYGCCAVALSAHQPDLPSGWIGGDRVAIHGTTGPVGSAASSGCLRATDGDVSRLTREVPLGAPVFVTG